MTSLLSSIMYGPRSLVRTPLYSKTAAYLLPKCILAPAKQVPTRTSGHCWRKNRDTPIFFSRTRLTNSSAVAVTAADSSSAHTKDGSMLNEGAKRMEEPIRSSETSFEHHQIANFCGRKFPLWISNESGPNIDMGKQIFCNRSLNMKSIIAIGFDMDYTLAQYRPETFETLAYNGTLKKLVYNLGYPKELLQWKFDWRYMVRGLVLDKKRGNILKMDRHKYVKVAYHGFKEMLREDRFATYGSTLLQESFDEPDYALIDTLFSLAEAYLFAQLVELKDAHPEKLPAGTDYSQIYKDVRAAVDLCHRDGTVKQAVACNPSKFIHEDQMIVPLLKMLRNSGRMTFLVTNSLWDYTHVVMNYLCGKCGGSGTAPRDDEWLNYFDVVITGSSKPGFFKDENRVPLFEVDIRTGMLQNTDNGTPLAQIGGSGLSPGSLSQREVKQGCKVFQGGNVGHLHQLLSIEASSQVLYVGDHIYGDILRSKKQLGWRTMLVVPELERELELICESKDIRKDFRWLRQQRDRIEDKLQWLKWALKSKVNNEEEQHRASSEVNELQLEMDRIRELHRKTQSECHEKVHELWALSMELDQSRVAWTTFRLEERKLYVGLRKMSQLLRENYCSVPYARGWHAMYVVDYNKYKEANLAYVVLKQPSKFHKIWGQLLKTGYQNSRFANQVERFACLYTSQVTNLCYYSPNKCYRTSEDCMPHEFDILGP